MSIFTLWVKDVMYNG